MGVIPLTEVFAFQITDIMVWTDWTQASPKPDTYTAKGRQGEAHHFDQAERLRYNPEVGQFVIKWPTGAVVFCKEEDFKCDFAHLGDHRYATAQTLPFLRKGELPMENPALAVEIPKMVTVWMEGYQCTGEASKAQLVGSVYADSFEEACNRLAEQNPERSWNEERTAIWGCRLFDNEADARKAYG